VTLTRRDHIFLKCYFRKLAGTVVRPPLPGLPPDDDTCWSQ